MAQDYRDLMVWQKAVELTVLIYKITQSFPQSELYGLSSQMRRASISIASNIAEGRGRISGSEFRQFLGVARGSTTELLTQIHVARALGFGAKSRLNDAERLGNEVSKMLLSFIQTLNRGPQVRLNQNDQFNGRKKAKATGYRLPATGYEPN